MRSENVKTNYTSIIKIYTTSLANTSCLIKEPFTMNEGTLYLNCKNTTLS